MNQLIHLLARLYPRSWRDRYGAEFAALLDDLRPDGRTAADVLAGALAMHIRVWKSWKILAASALVGAVVIAGLFAAFPRTYVSRAVVNVTGPADGDAIDAINDIDVNVESIAVLTRMITTYGLYIHDRSRMPLIEVIDNMKKHIRIEALGQNAAFSVSFDYGDPATAQRVTEDLASQFLNQSRQSQNVNLRILDSASLPQSPIRPNKPLIIGFGVTSFLLMWGGLSAWQSISARRYAVAGPSVSSSEFSGGGTVALTLPPFRRHLRRNAWKILFAVALLIAVGTLSYKLANPSYESMAVVRIRPRAGQQTNADYIASLAHSVESRESLAGIIADHGLYQSEYHPEKAMERMKEHIRIQPLGRNAAIGIRFTYSDRHIAQKVTQELAAKFVQQASSAADSPVSFSILDSASLPESPNYPVEANYPVGLVFGLLLGLILAMIVALFRRQPAPV